MSYLHIRENRGGILLRKPEGEGKMRRGAVVFLILTFAASLAYGGVPGFMKEKMGTLEGQFLTEKDKPLVKGIVSFFNEQGGAPPLAGSARRVPDMVTRSDEAGHFSVKLLPGKYFMGALIRDPSAGPGPPREGEKYFFAMAEEGKLRVFEVKTKETTNTAEVMGESPDKFVQLKDFGIIQGEVKDEQGKPLAGILVTVKEDLSDPRPQYISEPTRKDGRYQLKLPPGKYFISARESLQTGRPRPGSYVGTYGKTAPVEATRQTSTGGAPAGIGAQGSGGEAIVIEAKSGQTYDGVNINLYRIPDPEKTRQQYEEEARIRNENEALKAGQ
jgi:hypothetical protein